jgi:hypothetical protein
MTKIKDSNTNHSNDINLDELQKIVDDLKESYKEDMSPKGIRLKGYEKGLIVVPEKYLEIILELATSLVDYRENNYTGADLKFTPYNSIAESKQDIKTNILRGVPMFKCSKED